MPTLLSLLHRSRTRTGSTDPDAVRASVRQARQAEARALHRFCVAEQFAVLSALHPGRVDLGVGRSPGFTAPVRRALQHEPSTPEEFEGQLTELLDALQGRSAVPLRPALAPGTGPRVSVLATRHGLASAARLGLPVVVGGPALADPAPLRAYRDAFAGPGRGRVTLSLDVLVADSTAQARRQLLPQAWSLAIARSRGEFPPLPTPQAAAAAALTERERRRVEEALAATVHGTEGEVGDRLGALLAATGAVELLVSTTVHDPGLQEESDARLARLLAQLTTAGPATSEHHP